MKMPPLKGSHVTDDNNSCLQCHTTPDAWDPKDKAQYRFYVPLDPLKKDVHYQKGVNCVDCHGGDATVLETKAHQTDDFRSKPAGHPEGLQLLPCGRGYGPPQERTPKGRSEKRPGGRHAVGLRAVPRPTA